MKPICQYNNHSLLKIATLCPILKRFALAWPDEIKLLNDPLIRDITIGWGHRGQEDQDYAYTHNASKLKWPDSKHNKYPSEAVDIYPWPVDWKNEAAWRRMGKIGKNILVKLSMTGNIEWGGDWKNFYDPAHWQIIGR